ncbi:MAG: DUF1292 domain-containing protein [Clostridiales bacterium]|nr:DUF1292 domain-containing protein [Clostridiales bacterium]
MKDNLIELVIENKTELFELLLRFRFKGCDYIALCPEDSDDDSAAIFEVKKADNGEEIFSTISNDNLAKEVFVHFISIWEMTEEDTEE